MAKQTAFETLYKEHYRRVLGLCRRLLSANHSAEDATQEAFMRAYKNFGKYDPAQPFWGWIATIANNHCIDLLRQQNRVDQLFGTEAVELEELAASEASIVSRFVDAENVEALNRGIADLPDKYRVPLVLAYFNQASYDEIANQLGISRSHVGVLLLRAKRRLRTALNKATDRSPTAGEAIE